jgi:hypothetical protein
LLIVLSGCGESVDQKNSSIAPLYGVREFSSVAPDNVENQVVERCYGGVVYIVNSRGGMTHKVDNQRANHNSFYPC